MKHLIAILKLNALLLLSILPFCSSAQTNLALNRPVTVSSVQPNTSYTGNLAVDGNSSTRWSSAYSDDQWIYVDLGSQYNITEVKITWETALGKNYSIDVSNDASAWTTIKTISGNTSTSNDNIVSGSGRYVRIHGTLRGTTFGYSIWELQIFGSTTQTSSGSSSNLALNRPVTVSSVQPNTSYTGNLAVDGNSTTRWSSAYSDPQWIYVDLGAQYNISEVKISWETALGKNYNIDVSNDASTWTTMKSITGNTSTSNDNTVSGTGRYVRIYGSQRGTTFGYSIWELQVYGSATSGSSGSSSGSGSGSSSSGSSGSSGSTSGGSGSGTLSTSGKTYYFSTSDGDDSRSSTQAQNSSTPWKTLSKLNSFFSSLQPGDQVAFKRGDTFYGTITATKSGTSSAPILIAAYGTGSNPVITGFTTISSWSSVGNGRYQSTVSGGLSTCNMVTRDGSFQAMGKMPKGNTGYYSISGVGTNSITSSSISGLPSYTGGEICWRPYHWVLWRGTITSQTSTSVSYTPFASTSGGSTENPRAGYGFFFQNSPAACTQLGEWAYNSSHVLTVYFGSDNPSSHTIQMATIDNLVTGSNLNYLSFNNITFQGANSNVFNLLNCGHITINSCSIFFSGIYGIWGNGTSPNWSVTNNNISYSNSIGVLASSSSSAWTVSGNTISNSGAVAGMGGSGEGQYFGVKGVRSGSTVSSNTITNSGYDPLMFDGTNNTIQNNFVDYFGFVKDDAGGIYCGAGENLTGSKITGNIVTRGIGCPTGTPDHDMRAEGIYIDDGANNVEIGGNTVAFMGVSGLYCHNAHQLNIHDNTFFDNTYCSAAFYNDGNTTASVTYTNNINFAKTSSELVYESSGGSILPISFFTTLDYNHYCRPMAETNDFVTLVPNSTYNFSSWKSFIGKDAHSTNSPKTVTDTSQIKFYYNNTTAAKTFSFSGTYLDPTGKSYTGSITLQPYTSGVLILSSGTTTKAVANTTEVLDANPIKASFVVDPNPVTDNFAIELNNSHMGNMNVQIVNESGQLMHSLMFNKNLQSMRLTLSANDLSTGVYFVHVQIGDWSDVKKILKR